MHCWFTLVVTGNYFAGTDNSKILDVCFDSLISQRRKKKVCLKEGRHFWGRRLLLYSNNGACLLDLQTWQFGIIYIFSNCSSRFCVCRLLVVLSSKFDCIPIWGRGLKKLCCLLCIPVMLVVEQLRTQLALLHLATAFILPAGYSSNIWFWIVVLSAWNQKGHLV